MDPPGFSRAQVAPYGVAGIVAAGARRGLLAWGILNVVGYLFCALIPLTLLRGYTVTALYARWTLILLLAYMICGLVFGALAGLAMHLVQRRDANPNAECLSRRLDLAVTFSLLLPYVKVFFPPLLPASSAHAFLFLVPWLGAALVLCMTSFHWFTRLRLLVNPWIISILLVGPFVLSRQFEIRGYGSWFKLGIPLLVVSAVIAAALLSVRIPFVARAMLAPSRLVRNGLPAAITLALLGTFFFNDGPDLDIPFPQSPPSNPQPPSVLMVVLDTVRADHLSLYGYDRDTTPHLKKFARHATLYSRAVSASDMTLASHASLFTGLYATTHGSHYAPPHAPHGTPLDGRFETLAGILSGAGYTTVGVAANYAFLTPAFKLTRGFDLFDCRTPLLLWGRERYAQRFVRDLLRCFFSVSDLGVSYRRGEEINANVFDLLRRIKKKSTPPFFLFVNYMDAHDPYIPPAPFDSMFPGKNETFGSADYDRLRREVNRLTRVVTPSEHRHLTSQYDGAIAYLDSRVANLLSTMKELGLYEDTLIIITSDHGESFGDRNLMEHGVGVYQEQVHVPLLIKYPHQNQGQIVDTLVSGTDLMPTILGVLGCKAPIGLPGMDLRDTRIPTGREVLSESFAKEFVYADGLNPRFDRIERGVFSGPMKLIISTAGKRELYDLSKDPGEEHNLYRPDDGFAVELEAGLKNFLSAHTRRTPRPTRFDKRTMERLKSLGYAQ